jgi:DNA repair protein RadC
MADERGGMRLADARQRLQDASAKSLNTVELLGIVMGTGAIGHAVEVSEGLMISHHGLLDIARLTLTELDTQPGIGLAKAVQLQAVLELGKRMAKESVGSSPIIRSPDDVAKLCMPDMSLFDQEVFRAVGLNVRRRMVTMRDMLVGSLNAVSGRTGELFRDVIRHNCHSVIFVHNHPSGDPSPTAEDLQMTRNLIAAGKLLDIEVDDHVIIGVNNYVSLRERGLAFESA